MVCGFALSGALATHGLWSGGGAGASPPGSLPTRAPYVAGELIVGYRPGVDPVAEVRRLTGIRVQAAQASSGAPDERVLRLPHGTSVLAAADRIRGLPGIRYAVPNYVAHIAGQWVPNDRGRTRRPRGWERLQWNFLPAAGVNAPAAWATLIRDHRAGARGVRVAVLDTGIAYRNWGHFRRSPDFAGTRFVDPCDLVLGHVRSGRCTDPYALDRNGHGTFVAGTIAEATNNRIGVTGLAYRAAVIPVRVLDAQGNGDASTIASGIRYAVREGARVINLSIEFTPGTSASEIPSIISAIHYAYRHRVVVVGAAGNDSASAIAYPARDNEVVSVGATTSDRCLAYYSNTGRGLDLVAPGGGDDSASVHSANCHPNRNLPGVFQMTFNDPRHPDRFSLPGDWWGTSMSTPEVSAAAAMVIASRVIGARPTPARILQQLEYSARPLGSGDPNAAYGYGLLDLGAAVAGRASPPSGTTTTITTPTATTSHPLIQRPSAGAPTGSTPTATSAG